MARGKSEHRPPHMGGKHSRGSRRAGLGKKIKGFAATFAKRGKLDMEGPHNKDLAHE